MNKIIFLFAFTLIAFNGFAQEVSAKSFKWKTNPKLHLLSEEEAKEQEIVILKDISYEFVFENDKLYTYFFYHLITKVNTDKAIKRNNRVYFPTGNVDEIVKIKARVINSKGEIKELDENDFKTAEDDENRTSNKYFAFEGIDIGSEIEYYYLLKKKPRYTGKKVKIQTSVAIKKLKFTLTCPDHLVFKFLSTNGLKEVKEDKNVPKRHRWYLNVYNLKALKDEPMSAYTASLQAIIYKLSHYTNKPDNDLYTFDDAGRWYFENYQKEVSKKEEKKLKSLLKEIDISEKNTTYGKIRQLEDFLKVNFILKNTSKDDFKDISKILSNRVYSETGAFRLYTSLLSLMNIKYEFVITCDRDYNVFDEYFDSYSFLQEEFLYFPELDQLLSPSFYATRLGFIPSDYTETLGLFVKNKFITNIQFIKALDCYVNTDTQTITIDFTEEIEKPTMFFTKSESALSSRSDQADYDYLDEEGAKELDEELAHFLHEDIKVNQIKIFNKGGKYIGISPLITKANIVNTDMFIEKAGNKYLFKLGELIGPQLEMYQEKMEERQMDITSWYNRSFFHRMKIILPEGYHFTNLEDLNFSHVLNYKNKESAYFKSSYVIDGNEISINIDEIYNNIHYPKSYLEKLKAVVNAAADFNKVSLILVKD